MVQTMTTDELIKIYKTCGPKNIDCHIALCQEDTPAGPKWIKKWGITYFPASFSLFDFEPAPDTRIKYCTYTIKELKQPNNYGNKFIVFPLERKYLDFSIYDKNYMLHFLDRRIQKFEEIYKKVKQKNKEWKIQKDFE